jgi:hypothetical protein
VLAVFEDRLELVPDILGERRDEVVAAVDEPLGDLKPPTETLVAGIWSPCVSMSNIEKSYFTSIRFVQI